MVVALGAAEGATQPGVGDRAHAFGAVLREVFLHLGAAFAGHHVEAIVAARDELLISWVRQKIAGELLAGEDVERLIGVKSVDDVIAVREDALILVPVVADRVGKAGDIEPPDRHAFAETWGGQQAIDLLLIGGGRIVGQEGSGLGGRGRQSGQVERDATQQAFLRGFGRGLNLLLGEFGADEGVDRVLASGGQGGDDGGLERLVGPVGFVDGTLRDPAAEEFLLRSGEGLVRLLVRHHVIFVLGEETLDDLALLGLARDDGDFAALAGLQRFGTDVQAQLTFSRLSVEAVAVEAGVRHDRTNVAIEADRIGGFGGSEESGDEQRGDYRQDAHGDVLMTTLRLWGFNGFLRKSPQRACQFTASMTT